MDAQETVSRAALVDAISGHTGQPARVVEQVLDGFADVLGASLANGKRITIRDVLSAHRCEPSGVVLSVGKRLAAVATGQRPPPQIRTGRADARELARQAASTRKRALAGALT